MARGLREGGDLGRREPRGLVHRDVTGLALLLREVAGRAVAVAVETHRSGFARPTSMNGSESARAWQRWQAVSAPPSIPTNIATCGVWSSARLVARRGRGCQSTRRTMSPLWQPAHSSGEGIMVAVSPVAMPAWHASQVVKSFSCRTCGKVSVTAGRWIAARFGAWAGVQAPASTAESAKSAGEEAGDHR